jgi:hypothetical protein
LKSCPVNRAAFLLFAATIARIPSLQLPHFSYKLTNCLTGQLRLPGLLPDGGAIPNN